ncbi:hypothetical protein FKM82_016044 [Ascaphus truei]
MERICKKQDIILRETSTLPRGRRSVMLTLASKLKRDDGVKGSRTSSTTSDSTRRVSIRDRLLVKEVAELEANLPCTCKVNFPDPDSLHNFQLIVSPGSSGTQETMCSCN